MMINKSRVHLCVLPLVGPAGPSDLARDDGVEDETLRHVAGLLRVLEHLIGKPLLTQKKYIKLYC